MPGLSGAGSPLPIVGRVVADRRWLIPPRTLARSSRPKWPGRSFSGRKRL